MLIRLGSENPQYIDPELVAGVAFSVVEEKDQYRVGVKGFSAFWNMTAEESAPLLAYLEKQENVYKDACEDALNTLLACVAPSGGVDDAAAIDGTVKRLQEVLKEKPE